MENAELGEHRKVGRNDPCPCGSGKKYKRCCIGAVERLDGRRVVERNGQRMLVSSGVSDAQLAAADEFFAAKAAGRGPAADIADFAAPFVDATDGSPAEVQRALNLAMFCWNLAVVRDDHEREEHLNDFLAKAFKDDEVREHFRDMANAMVERHRMMFPKMHEERRG